MKNIKKRVAMLLCAVMVLSLMCVGAFATGGDSSGASGTSAEVISAFQAGFQAIKSDAMSMIAVAAPIAISIAAVIFLSRKAMSWFKGMAK